MQADAALDCRASWEERYRLGQTPWDTGITPPEVVRFWSLRRTSFRGRHALDLGCGAGLNTLFLARQGLRAIGIDFSGLALGRAIGRLAAASDTGAGPGPGEAMYVLADVGKLPLHGLEAVYALDVGCLHSLPAAARPAYAAGVGSALATGGYLHLYAFDRDPAQGTGAPGMDAGEVARLFGSAFMTVSEERGRQRGKSDRASRWYLLLKT